jgi:hypothetical protein
MAKRNAVKTHVEGGWLGSARSVMAGHSRSKNGVASLAYVPAIHVFHAANA